MARVVSLYLPTWPTDRARRTPGSGAPPAEVPFALIGRLGRRRVVLAADAAAQRAGARIGMAAAQATALVPGLVTRAADPRGDAAALERLALWALGRYAPIVAADPPDGIVIDTTGADHLLGGEQALLEDLVARCAAAPVAARAAVADSWGAAHAAARWLAAPVFVLAPGAVREVLPALPVAALRLPAEIVAACRVLGLQRIGDLAGQPRAPLALRFSGEAIWSNDYRSPAIFKGKKVLVVGEGGAARRSGCDHVLPHPRMFPAGGCVASSGMFPTLGAS